MGIADKVRTVTLSSSATPTRTRHFVDQEALDDTFGPDAREHYMEDTLGKGAAYRDGHGGFVRRNERERTLEPVDPQDLMTGEDIG